MNKKATSLMFGLIPFALIILVGMVALNIIAMSDSSIPASDTMVGGITQIGLWGAIAVLLVFALLLAILVYHIETQFKSKSKLREEKIIWKKKPTNHQKELGQD